MSRTFTVAVLSDIHYASAAEQARGNNYEFVGIPNPVARFLLRNYRHYIWLRHPLWQNQLVEKFLQESSEADYAVANGDYSCNSAFVGVSDEAACQSARECLDKLRGRFGERLRATMGDHELGKISFIGGRGGMRLRSYHRAVQDLGLKPFWNLELGRYSLIGVGSSLLALPVLEPDTLPEERSEWNRLRSQHLAEIRTAFESLSADRRVVLFCHDPSALPFLWQEESVRSRLPQVEQTLIGHLHSRLILWKSRLLAGMPPIRFLGHAVHRMTRALHNARCWQHFRVRLCPSLAGIELLKDGGFYLMRLHSDADWPAAFHFHPIPR